MDNKKKKIYLIALIILCLAVLILVGILLFYFLNYPKNGPSNFEKSKKIKNNFENYISETLKTKYPESDYTKGNLVNFTYSGKNISCTYFSELDNEEIILTPRFNLNNSFEIENLLNNIANNNFTEFENSTFSMMTTYQATDATFFSSIEFQKEFPRSKINRSYISIVNKGIENEYYFASFIGTDKDGNAIAVNEYQYEYKTKVRYNNPNTQISISNNLNDIYYNLLAYLATL